MKIYIASSWKNETAVLAFAILLRSWGHQVDCFCDTTTTGRFVFHPRMLGVNPEELDAVSFLALPQAQKVFIEDRKWIDWADLVIMYLPCGKSSHLEAGYAAGKGKLLFIFSPGGFPKGEYDAMYGFADVLCNSLGTLKYTLEDYSKEIIKI